MKVLPGELGRAAYPEGVVETSDGAARAFAALSAAGIPYAVTRHGPVGSLAEAAALRGVRPGDIVKTLVVRRAAWPTRRPISSHSPTMSGSTPAPDPDFLTLANVIGPRTTARIAPPT